MVSSAIDMDLSIPTLISLLSRSANFSFVSGSSERPRAFKNLKRVPAVASIDNSFTDPTFFKTPISAIDLTPSTMIMLDFDF